MWTTVKSIIFCHYCRRRSDEENEESSALLKKENKNATCNTLQCDQPKFGAEMNYKHCQYPSTCGIQNANFQGMHSTTKNVSKNKIESSDTPNPLQVSNTKSLAYLKNGTMGNESSAIGIPKLAIGDQISASSAQKPPIVLKATKSVSDNTVSANSPLWRQMESLNSVLDARPPTMK